MNKNIIIVNPQKFQKLIQEMKKDKARFLHVLSDFDRTLTYAFVKGERVPSMISILRSSGDYLGEEYAKEAQALFQKYHQKENDPKIPLKERKRLMREWWLKHYQLLIKSGLSKKHLKIVIDSQKIRLRKGAKDFFKLLSLSKIPIVIMSASGLGTEAISMFLKKEKFFYSNIYIISNSFKWNKNGKAIGVKEPIIHSLNKDETIVKNFPFYKKIKNRKNVILLGDSPEDVGMVEGFAYKNLIKIGFLNEDVNKNLKLYKKVFDVLILNDSSLHFIKSLIKKLVVEN
jgi:5'-nucleotidase